MTNAYVTTGHQIRKRPGLTRVATLETGTTGLRSALGVLNTFYSTGTITHANSLFAARKVPHPSSSQAIEEVHYADVFNGYIYCSIEFANGDVKHFYLDDPGVWLASTVYSANAFRRPTVQNGFKYEVTAGGGGSSGGSEPAWPTVVGVTVVDNALTWTCRAYNITDVNCPNSKSLIKQKQSIIAIDGENVDYSATSDVKDWTTANDAGFLATGLQQAGATDAIAVAEYQDQLVVFFKDGIQVWFFDPTPTNIALTQRIFNIGTRYRRAHHQLAGDLVFLADSGFRSLTISSQFENMREEDIGSPIDDLVVPYITDNISPISVYYPRLGQFWSIIGAVAFVYTFSKISKVTAWSYYEFPFTIDDAATLNGELYLRSGDAVYRVNDSIYTDDGNTITVSVRLPFLTAKEEGVLKQFYGVDTVCEGTAEIKFLYDPNDETKETDFVQMLGDTYPKGLMPMEMTCEKISPYIRHAANEEFSLSRLSLYYHSLGVL